MIVIKLLNKDLLLKYIYSDEFYSQEFIPISQHRALSQIKNPRLNDNDVLLLLAYDENKLVGYLGVLPDKIYLINNKIEKYGWMSCIWVSDKYRGKKIAQQLLEKCFEAWNNKIIATEFTSHAKKLYDKTNEFIDLRENNGIRLYVRLDLATILVPKAKLFEKVNFILKATDFIANSILDLRFSFITKKLADLQIEYNSLIDDGISKFINSLQQKELFRRGIEELNWIIENPWVLSSKQKNSLNKKYHFSSVDKSFEFYTVKICNADKQLIAFMIFSKRNQSLKLPYCYYSCDLETIANIIQFHIVKWRVNTFTIFNSEIAGYLRNHKTIALFKKNISRQYIISNTSNNFSDNKFEIQDGDGDCAFT